MHGWMDDIIELTDRECVCADVCVFVCTRQAGRQPEVGRQTGRMRHHRWMDGRDR
jgi:hypothetical protein